MVSDPVYNTQMGAAELSALLKEYSGSYIMTFAGYNAGRGRVREWVKLLRRSARSQGRSGRLGGAHSVLRNAQLRPARDGKYAGLSRALRGRHRGGGEERAARDDAGDQHGAGSRTGCAVSARARARYCPRATNFRSAAN